MQKYTKEWLEELCQNSFSYAEVLRKAGRAQGGGSQQVLKNKIKEWDIDVSHFKGQGWAKGATINNNLSIARTATKNKKYSFESLFCENSLATRATIRHYILKNHLLEYKCALCGNTGIWLNKTIALQLDHINGVNNDHRLSNLRWLCPNCHATTDTFAGKNNLLTDKNKITVKNTDTITNYCIDCGAPISINATRCRKCASQLRISDKPINRDTLKQAIRSLPFTQIAKQFNVTDNTIRKWCKKYMLPSTKKEINSYSNEEWNEI